MKHERRIDGSSEAREARPGEGRRSENRSRRLERHLEELIDRATD